jgi:hypothetical protein
MEKINLRCPYCGSKKLKDYGEERIYCENENCLIVCIAFKKEEFERENTKALNLSKLLKESRGIILREVPQSLSNHKVFLASSLEALI